MKCLLNKAFSKRFSTVRRGALYTAVKVLAENCGEVVAAIKKMGDRQKN